VTWPYTYSTPYIAPVRLCDGSTTDITINYNQTKLICGQSVAIDPPATKLGICISGDTGCITGECLCTTFSISNYDIVFSTGNTDPSYSSNTVYVEYFDCDTNIFVTETFTIPGDYTRCTSFVSGIWYYTNDINGSVVYSTYSTGIACTTSGDCVT
jgi:hypothetical protein